MDRQILNITANEQILTVDEPIRISTNKVNYIEARFDLGQNWTGYDSIRAVWFNDFYCISTVLDSQGVCLVPSEVMKRNGKVKVNLVGNISENDVLTDRLTSYPVVAVIVDCTAQITGANTQPITPSEFEQFAQRVHTDADRAEAGASASEQSAQNAHTSEQNASQSAQSAHDDKIAIEQAIAEVIQQIEDFEQVQVVVNTLPPSSPATSDFTDGVLTLGIPQGVKGDTGNGIQNIAKTGTSGLVDTYRITYTDGQTTTFTVTNGAKGDTGNGIASIEKTSTVGLVDTYTITYTDGTTTTFTVTNGEKGEKGDTGEVSQAEFDEAVTDLKNAFNNALSPIDIRTGNLCDGGIIDGYIRSNSNGYIYQWANADYSTGVFAVTAGDYITANFEWANNSYGLFTDDNDAVIANARDDCRQSDLAGYVYKVPTGATKLYFSFNSTALATAYSTYGIVCLVGKDDISTVRQGISTYPYGGTITREYYADDLHLRSGRTVASFESDVDGFGFIIRKNLFTAINEGEYCIAWNIGDSVTTASSANYAYGYADVSGCEKVTINLSNLSDTFSFFTDKNNKKLSGIADARIGTSRVYTVPEDAKRIYVSCQDASLWSEYGMVIFDGEDDIVTNPVNATSYPYLVKKEYADNVKLSNGKSLIEIGEGNNVYRVEKDGSGDFTSFVEAITEACKHMDSVVYVGAGAFDLLDELGSTYVSNASSSQMGLVLKNRVHVICSSQTVLEMDYDGTLSNAKEYLSPINTGDYGCTLENATIIDNNVRYSIHDDRGWAGDTPYTNKFINCTLIHKNGKYGDCIGGGLGENCAIEIRGCYLEGDANVQRLAYYHGNNHTGITNAKGRIVVCDNYFANAGSFWVHKYGDSTEMTTAYVSNNSFGSAPQTTTGTGAQDNMRMIAWNNEIRS